MALTRKAGGTRASPKKEPGRSTAKSHKKNKTSIKNALGFFDLPPEIRNSIYRYVIISDEPIDVHYHEFRRNGRSRCRFNIPPALTLASKQLRLETQRLFLEGNELRLMPELLKQRKSASLLALRRMHRNVGLEIQTLHISWELNKRHQILMGLQLLFKAQLTLRKIEGRIVIDKQDYSVQTLRTQGVAGLEVCGCGIQQLAHIYNMSSRSPDILLFLQRLKERRDPPSYYTTDLSIAEEIIGSDDFCRNCSTRNAAYVKF